MQRLEFTSGRWSFPYAIIFDSFCGAPKGPKVNSQTDAAASMPVIVSIAIYNEPGAFLFYFQNTNCIIFFLFVMVG